MGILKVSIFQKSLETGLSPALFKRLASLKSDFLIFPEFFCADSSVSQFGDLRAKSVGALDWLLKLSDSYRGILVGGTLLLEENGALFNACPVVYQGEVIDWYRKRALDEYDREVSAGTEPGIFILKGHRFAILLCSEIEREEYLSELAEMEIRLIFAPMKSPLRQEDNEAKLARDQKMFIDPASRYNMSIVKCCSTGKFLGQPSQGRSLVAAPTGISWRVAFQEEDQEILKTVMVHVP